MGLPRSAISTVSPACTRRRYSLRRLFNSRILTRVANCCPPLSCATCSHKIAYCSHIAQGDERAQGLAPGRLRKGARPPMVCPRARRRKSSFPAVLGTDAGREPLAIPCRPARLAALLRPGRGGTSGVHLQQRAHHSCGARSRRRDVAIVSRPRIRARRGGRVGVSRPGHRRPPLVQHLLGECRLASGGPWRTWQLNAAPRGAAVGLTGRGPEGYTWGSQGGWPSEHEDSEMGKQPRAST